jgi:outer membrane protein
MKRIIFAGFLSVLLITVNAQTEKGDWLVGGRIDINTGDNSTHIGINPNGGYFVIRNVAVGGNLMIDYSKTGDGKVTDIGIGPFARYYFGNAKARPLLQAGISFISSQAKGPGFSNTNSGSNIFLGGGVAIFINDNATIEILTGYSNTKYKGFKGSGGFNLGIGFQVYLSRRQVDNLRGN